MKNRMKNLNLIESAITFLVLVLPWSSQAGNSEKSVHWADESDSNQSFLRIEYYEPDQAVTRNENFKKMGRFIVIEGESESPEVEKSERYYSAADLKKFRNDYAQCKSIVDRYQGEPEAVENRAKLEQSYTTRGRSPRLMAWKKLEFFLNSLEASEVGSFDSEFCAKSVLETLQQLNFDFKDLKLSERSRQDLQQASERDSNTQQPEGTVENSKKQIKNSFVKSHRRTRTLRF